MMRAISTMRRIVTLAVGVDLVSTVENFRGNGVLRVRRVDLSGRPGAIVASDDVVRLRSGAPP